MIKICLSVLAAFISILSVFSQDLSPEDTLSENKKLSLEEVNFVSSYYTQDGNNAAVTGGIGSEQLTDFSNNLELKFVKNSGSGRVHSFSFELGVDAYTSASSDQIDPSTVSSASSGDRRIYPTLSYAMDNQKKRLISGASIYLSKEYDYTSIGPGIFVSKYSKDNNRELTIKLQTFFDNIKIILPVELRGNGISYFDGTNRNSINTSLVFSQVINERTDFAALVDVSYQSGLLSMPFQRVYFSDGQETVEKLPDNRLKIPFGFRLNYFLGDRTVLKSFFRFYTDSWGLTAQTASLEVPVKITPFISVSPFYRFYYQNGIKYFNPYRVASPLSEFHTSDYDLSDFSSHLLGMNLRKFDVNGLWGIKKWHSIDLRYAYYYRTTGLSAHSVAIAFMFK